MKKYSLLLCLLLALSATLEAATAQHKKIHAFILRNGAFWDNSYGFGEFYMDDPSTLTLTCPYSDNEAIFAGACVNSVYYAFGYSYEQNGPEPTSLFAYDLISGKRQELGEYTDKLLFRVIDATYDYTTSTFYAIGYENGIGEHLYTVDLTTGKLTDVVELTTGLGTIAADKSGQLYGISIDGTLYKVDKTNGQTTEVCTLDGYSGLISSSESMEFDLNNGLLYWAANVYSTEDHGRSTYLLQIDLSTTPVTVTNLGEIGVSANVYALFIPFIEAGDEAPAAPTDLTVTPAGEGLLEATLSWTTPTLNYSGKALEGLLSVSVVREGTLVATLPITELGQPMTYIDNTVERDSSYRYSVYATNVAGDGDKAEAFAYVGHDRPDAVTDVKVSIGDGCQSATLTWDAPTQGYYGGYFTADGLTYDILRTPDNKTVATGLTECTFTDTSMRRLGRYDYTITARNAFGATSYTTCEDGYVIGKPLDLPMTESLNDISYFNNRFQAYDGNGDGLTWGYSNYIGTYQFGNSLNCVDYLNGQTSDLTSALDADEWLITPPLRFDQSKHYVIRIMARSVEDDVLEVTTGSNNEIGTQQKCGEIVVKSWDGAETPAPIHRYEANLPEGMNGTLCVGLHLITPAPTDVYHPEFLQIMSISVEEGTANAISDISAAVQPSIVSIYGLNGTLLAHGPSVAAATSQLAKGIYLVKQGGQIKKITLK